jgi:L-histidine Nalpha-methyltransferase / hercynylcysteine S-oxide synthase
LTSYTPNGKSNGHSNGNGYPKVLSNGHSNGHTDGYTNGHANGHTNGKISKSIKLRDSYMDDILVRTVYGPVPLKHALHWPVFASFDELAGCAAWMGGRIPTAEEARSIYSYVDSLKLKEIGKKVGKTVPAVNAYVRSILPSPYFSFQTPQS